MNVRQSRYGSYFVVLEIMRILAIFSGVFSLGIFLSQYLLHGDRLLFCGAAAFVLSCGALLLPQFWRKRILLAGVALSLAFGYQWLYIRQVLTPMEACAETKQFVTMTLQEYAVPTD